MRERELTKSSAAAPTDLLVCFPTRAHLTAFMPKPVCSPARLKLTEPGGHVRHSLPRRGMKKSGSTARRGQTSPALWTKTTKQMGPGPIASEPTSPKVTCAGQIKKPRIGGGQSWQSVMEEIEKIHNNGKSKSGRPANRESSLGGGFINKEVMQFLTCLRNVRFNFRCFGAFPAAEIVSDEEENGEDCPEEEEEEEEEDWEENSKAAVFSKWFMVLQDAKETKTNRQPETGKKQRGGSSWDDNAFAAAPLPPPPNTLLLMRCRSAPAKTMAKEKEEEKLAFSTKAEDGKLRSPDDGKKKLRLLIHEEKKEEEEERKKQQGIFMETYDTTGRHCIFSAEIAKETWVLGGNRDTLPRSWSSKS